MASETWTVRQKWLKVNDTYHAEYTSQKIIQECAQNLNHKVEFPPIIQGAHQIFLDGMLIKKFGDPKFNYVESYYGAPTIDCRKISQGKELVWKTYSFTQGFTNFYYYPRLTKQSYAFFINEMIYVMSAGVMLILGIFCGVTFSGKVNKEIVASLVFSNFFSAIYFSIVSSKFFTYKLSMLYSHKLSDASLLIGSYFFLNVLKIEKYIPVKVFRLFTVFISIGIIMIFAGKNGDQIQNGTSFPFASLILIMLAIIFTIVKKGRAVFKNRKNMFQGMSLIFYSGACIYDMIAIYGIVPPYFLYSIGVLMGLLFLALSVNEKIIKAYDERDFLRKNLEQEVERKTAELKIKNQALKRTLEDLRHKEAGLIQAEKLASLGTLSAGIAHEINNSLNYVNGSLGPLGKVLKKNEELSETSKKKIFTFVDMMKEGLDNTFEIIRSLKNYTGLNQSAWKDVNVLDSVNASMTILQSRIKQGVKVVLNIDPSHHFLGNVVGFGQIMTNLLINSIDAMNEHGTIKITSYTDESVLTIELEDTGGGIPPEILKNVFDPFFTTKEVGKGTGLGLYIVNQEVQKHHGKIKIEVIENIGSKFILNFPINDKSVKEQEAS